MYKNHWHNNKTVIWLFHRKIQRHTDMSEISVTYEERRTDNIVGNKKRRPTLAKASIFWMIRQYHSICKYRLTKESIPFSWTRISIASNSNCGKSVAHFPIQKSTEYCKNKACWGISMAFLHTSTSIFVQTAPWKLNIEESIHAQKRLDKTGM